VIFLDIGFIFALVSTADAQHERVVEVLREFRDATIITTNYVVAETITLSRRLGHSHAVNIGDQLYKQELAAIHWATPDEELTA